MTITEITRGHIRLKVGDKSATLYGEALLPGYGSPDFVIYSNSMESWDPPNHDELISQSEKAELLSVVESELSERGYKVEIE